MFTSPGEIALTIGDLTIYWYGIIMAIAFLSGLAFIVFIAKKSEKEPEQVIENLIDLSLICLIGAIIGARLYYVVFNLDYFSVNLSEIPKLWHGGLSIHGALLGGFLFGSIYALYKKLSILKYADYFAFGLILGQSIGRWGNFFNSEAFGKPTNLPWKLYIPEMNRPVQYQTFEFFHPTFLYESIWNLFILAILYFLIKPYSKALKGVVFFSYLILYSIGRLLIEGIRIDSVYNFLGIPIAQWASVILIIIGVLGLFYVKIWCKKIKCI